MLGKLLKYEFKAYSRVLIPIYIAILAISFLSGLSFRNIDLLNEFFQSTTIIMLLVLFGLMVALAVLNIVTCIQRFKKNLLDNEGYLMFTLPVKVSNLVLSKLLVALLFSMLSIVVSILSFCIIMTMGANINFDGLITIAINDFDVDFGLLSKELIYAIITLILGLILMYSKFILTIYTSLSLGQLPIFNKLRTAVAFISFFVINFIGSGIENFVLKLTNPGYYNLIDSFATYSFTDPVITRMNITSTIFSLVLIIILFASTSYILDKNLNLE